MLKTSYLIKLTYYSNEKSLNIIKNNKIEIFNYQIVDTYQSIFTVSKKNYLKILKLFNQVEIIKIKGFDYYIKVLFLNKLLAFSIILSLIFYGFLNARIYSINILGTNDNINSYILNRLDEFSLKKYQKIPSNSELKEIEKILKMDLIDAIDLFSITKKGTYIFINYEKKGEEVIIGNKNGKMYAKKDAIIKSFNIESGRILKDINDYVKEGDLIVDDTLYYKEKEIVVGTKGKVYGYTYNRVSVSCKSNNLSVGDIYHLLLLKARNEVSKLFDENCSIEKEVILSYFNQNGIANMDLHYTLVENIIKF